VIFGIIGASQLRLGNQSLQQKIGQGLYQTLCVSLDDWLRNWTFQLEDELNSIVALLPLHGPSPCSLKDRIVRFVSDSCRTARERWQAR
jgi:hypothetical protein